MFCNKRRVFWSLSLVLLFSLLLALPASAAGRTRRPVEALPAVVVDTGYFYKEVNDFREIVSRFALSNAARSLGMIEEGVRSFFDVLRFWPAESMAFLIGEEARGEGREIACFALSYPEAYRDVLQKMEKGTIRDAEARSLFLGLRRSDEVALRITREEGSPIFKVRFGDFRFYCTARDNLLVCAFDDDDLAKSLAALSSGRHFARPSRAGKDSRNFAILEAGSLTDKIMYEFFNATVSDGTKGRSLHIEMDFAFVPGGWKLDVETNLAALLNLDRGEAKADVPAFERLGGGRLLAATSAVLGKDIAYARASRVLRNFFSMGSSYPPILRAFLGVEDGGEALDVERVDVAVLSYPGLKWPDGIGFYSCMKISNKARLAELQRETEAFLAARAQDDPYKKLESAKWKHLYAMDLSGEGIESSVMLGFADDAFLFAFLPKSGFDEPFATDRVRFDALALKPDAFLYADFERIRGSVRGLLGENGGEYLGRRRSAREFYSLLLALTSDITELSVTEKSPGTMTIEARTARPDIDDRMWIYELMEEM